MIADDIPLFEKPTKGAVRRAKSYARKWYLANIPVSTFDPMAKFEDALKEYLEQHTDQLAKVEEFNSGIEDHLTLLLTTNQTDVEVDELSERMTYTEYDKLVEKGRAILGGSAIDFLKSLTGGIPSKTMIPEAVNQSTSTKSRGRRGTGSKK